MSLPEVEVILAHGNWCVGDRFTPSGMYRDWLVRRGFVKVLPEPGVVEAAAVEVAIQPEPETAALRTERPKRKRGRPRKVDRRADYCANGD